MDSNAPATFGALLKAYRRARGLSQEAVAERAGISRDAISLLERGLRLSPQRDTVGVLAQALQLSAGERAQLLAAAPARRWHPVAVHRADLGPPLVMPFRLTSFVGRERELAEVRELVLTRRLLTLTGAGGIGKTSLALEVAVAARARFADGVALVELAALTDGELVPHAVAAAFGVREQPGEPILMTLARVLGTTQRLLVLDNCEHLLLTCAKLAEGLLQTCPNVGILVTSREPLRVGAEAIWRVPALTLSDRDTQPLAELAKSEAIHLFVERAAAIRPGFTLTRENAAAVAEICRRLDGIPLAIELAAARVAAMTPAQIARHLTDRFYLLTTGSRTALPRHQTLRATLDWSYDLLTLAEQSLLRHLAVFEGGATIEAAEELVAPIGIQTLAALDGIASLVGKSMLEVVEREEATRFTLLETTREYALGRLRESGEGAAARSRHAAYYLALAESQLRRVSLGQFELERDNLRAALRWFADSGDVAAGARLIEPMSLLWNFNGPLAEIRGWLARLRALPGFANVPDEARGMMLMAEGRLELRRDPLATRRSSEQLLALGRSAANPDWMLMALHRLGWSSLELGELSRAEEELTEKLALSRKYNDRTAAGGALILLGDAARLRGEDDLARARYLESRSLGEPGHLSWQLRNLGHLAVHHGDLGEADSYYRESVVWYENHAHTLGQVECLVGFAALAVARGDAAKGARLLGAVDAALTALGVKLYPGDSYERERALHALHASLSEDAFASAWAEGQAMALEQAIHYALEDGPNAHIRSIREAKRGIKDG
jgi:non-specific serine/threonine protein kinase